VRGRESGTYREVGSHVTVRRPDGVVETTLRGRISVDVLEEFGAAYMAIGGALWLLDAHEMVNYDAAAVPAASAAFVRWAKHGLRRALLVTSSPAIRMAAISIRLGVKLATGVTIEVYATRDEAEREIAKELRAARG
jgi:hypothetical protein